MTSTTKPSKEPKKLTFITIYLFLYNVIQFIGWSGVYLSVILHLVSKKSTVGLFDKSQFLLSIFQTAALLEVVHVAIGFVKSSLFLTFFQVASRIFLLWGILYSVPQVQDNIGVAMLLVAWSVTEIIRYSFYAFNLLQGPPYLLVWFRYTLFIVLYPIGVSGELLCIFAALPFVKESAMYSYHLPNRLNISFDYWTIMIVAMLNYIPIFPQLYLYMFAQRKKIIGGGSVDHQQHKKTE